MPANNSSLASLMKSIGEEVDEEGKAGWTEEQRLLEAISKELLHLERDLTLPDRTISKSARVARLIEFIEKKDF